MLDRKALRELILGFARLLGKTPEIAEADLNPVRCTTHGCVSSTRDYESSLVTPVERVKTW